MRALYAALAIAQVRWACADIARAARLSSAADAALCRARERIRVADELAHRAGLGPVLTHLP